MEFCVAAFSFTVYDQWIKNELNAIKVLKRIKNVDDLI